MEQLVERAQAGDRNALESLVRAIQDPVHHLAMRILVNPEDAREATQEILITVVTKLSTFEGRSAFKTWVYRVAANHLLTAKKIADRDLGLTFEAFSEDLHAGLVTDPAASVEDELALSELRISCTMAMLLCLDLKHRVAYVLGDVLELDHGEAAEVMSIAKANYRKRLSRARKAVVDFTSKTCGLANETAKCSCPRRMPAAKRLGRVDPDNLAYAGSSDPSYGEVLNKARAVERSLRTMTLQRATPLFACPEDLGATLSRIVGGSP